MKDTNCAYCMQEDLAVQYADEPAKGDMGRRGVRGDGRGCLPGVKGAEFARRDRSYGC